MENMNTMEEQKFSLLKLKVSQTHIDLLNKLTANYSDRSKTKSDLEQVTSRFLEFILNKNEVFESFLEESTSDEWRVEQAMQDQTTRNQILALINQTNKKTKSVKKPKDMSN